MLHELRTTHNQADWFTPINAAVAGMTPEQARWVPKNAQGKVDPENNHSVGMLAYHLLFWNRQTLARMRGEKPAQPATNTETFNDFNAANWAQIVKDLDQVMADLEAQVGKMSDAELAKWAPTVANVATHNAYHTGQILYVRKLQGSWNPDNGVK
jgi:uncharacterized damage-inducible protein DinB